MPRRIAANIELSAVDGALVIENMDGASIMLRKISHDKQTVSAFVRTEYTPAGNTFEVSASHLFDLLADLIS